MRRVGAALEVVRGKDLGSARSQPGCAPESATPTAETSEQGDI
jgi:hypothetical protein